MVRTTPPRLVDLEELFPGLSPHARTSTLLHPRWGSPGVEDSSVGGPLLWPAGEDWPTCPKKHGAAMFGESVARVRADRARKAAEALGQQTPAAPAADEIPPEQVAQALSHDVSGPTPLLPIAQLYARDVPDLPTRPGIDLLQVLWCPFDHDVDEFCAPSTRLVWRDSTAVDRSALLTDPPEPLAVEYADYVPSPCVLHPEQVVEYPPANELYEVLDEELCLEIADWCLSQLPDSEKVAAVAENEPYENANLYDEIAASSAFKVGGWMIWGSIDPYPVTCSCGATMTPLMQIGSGEWWSSAGYWTPIEDLDAARRRVITPHSFGNPPEIVLPRGLRMHIYLCPDDPAHPRAQVLA